MKIITLFLLFLTVLSIVTLAQYSVGISSVSGPIYTNAVLGSVYIKSLLAYNSSALLSYGTNIVLDAILQVQTPNEIFYFGLANGVQFITNTDNVSFFSDIWNATAPYTNMSMPIGKGNLGIAENRLSNGEVVNTTVYYYSTYYFIKYNLPFWFYLLINETYNSSGVEVDFGYIVIQNGMEVLPPNLIIYDSVFIPINNVESASFIINDSRTPSGVIDNIYYLGYLKDVELVWGGIYGYEPTHFDNMYSMLALYYNQSGVWKPFNHIYTYGNNTGLEADNLHVSISDGVAVITTGTPNPTSFNVNFTPPYLTYVNITSPIPYYLNGTLVNGNKVFYINEPLTIQFVKNYTLNSSTIAVLESPQTITVYPSNTPNAFYIAPNYTWYYKIIVSSPIPVYAIINGKNQTFMSGWYSANTSIVVENMTYYQSPDVRYIITSISPQSFKVNSPTIVNVSVVKQFLVTISSSYPVTIDGVVTSNEWVDSGSIIILNANLPFYETGSFVGTENIPLGGSVVVNQPINETLQTSINIALVGLITFVVGIGGAVPVLIRRRKTVTTYKASSQPPSQPPMSLPQSPPSPPPSPMLQPVYSSQTLTNWDPNIWVGKELYGYEVKSVIGKGGNGYVLKAELGRIPYAIKVFSVFPSTSGTVTMRAKSSFEQIYSESSNLRRLSEHPNIVKIYGIHIDMNVIGEILRGNVNAYLNHPPAIVMEFMKGGSVYDLLRNQVLISSPLWPLIVKEIIKQASAALAYIHANGFVHLDVKPQNIFLAVPLQGSPDEVYRMIAGNVKLGDLGSAVRIGSKFEQVTPAYASPEQIEALLFGGGADPKMDIYSLGMTAYTLLKGKNDNPVANYLTTSIDNFISGDIRKARELINQAKNILMNWKPTLPPNTPHDLEEIIIKALSLNPNERPTADEIVTKLS